MGSCQSTPTEEELPPPTQAREPQPYGSPDKPIKEEVAPRPSSMGGKSKKKKEKSSDKENKPPEGPRKSKSPSSSSGKKAPKEEQPAAAKSKVNNANKHDPDIDEMWRDCDDSRWKLREQQFNGSVQFKEVGKQEVVEGQSVEKGIETFKANPAKYVAMIYQTNMLTNKWPAASCMYTLIHRKDTISYEPKGVSPTGQQTILMHDYERLPPFPDNVLPKAHRDKYTDNMTHQGRLIHTPTRVPILPGRGMGVCDAPNLKIIGDVDPSDIAQGAVSARESRVDWTRGEGRWGGRTLAVVSI